jgi:maltose alpha-D-glucosyltransferase/alpha-amylase
LAHVIVVQNDFYITDFAGEPARPLGARRRKGSPLRDVAGMIRSFDYAAVAAVRQLAETRPAAQPRMAQLAEAWRQRAIDGFRAAYRRTMRGCPAYPASKRLARQMTNFFMLEKAVYEVSYELANRPDWVEIPMRGVLDVLARARGVENALPV